MEEISPDRMLDKIKILERLGENFRTTKGVGFPVESMLELKKQLQMFATQLTNFNDKTEPDFMQEVIDLLQMLDAKYKFDEILESGIRYTLTFSYVHSLIFQHFWNLERLSACLKNTENLLTNYLRPDQPLFFASESKTFKGKNQLFGRINLEKMRLSIFLAETFMQHTAVFSQLGRHEEALERSERCLDLLKNLLKGLWEIFSALSVIGPENVKGLGSFEYGFDAAMTYIEFLKELEVVNGGSEGQWSVDVPTWKINKDNTLKYIIQKIESQRGPQAIKSLLKKVDKPWVENFHISNVVKLQPLDQLEKKLEVGEFDENMIFKIALLLSCCIFSVAAENRFISHKEILDDEEEKGASRPDRNNKNGKAFEETSKDLKLQRHKRFIFSERVHLKALELLIFAFKDNIKLLNHFFQSYKKNYSFSILVIEEVDEPSFSTTRKSEYFDPDLKMGNDVIDINEITKLNKRISQLIMKKKHALEKNPEILHHKDHPKESYLEEHSQNKSKSQNGDKDSNHESNDQPIPQILSQTATVDTKLINDRSRGQPRVNFSPAKNALLMDIEAEKEMRQAADKNLALSARKMNFQKIKIESSDLNDKFYKDLTKKFLASNLAPKVQQLNVTPKDQPEALGSRGLGPKPAPQVAKLQPLVSTNYTTLKKQFLTVNETNNSLAGSKTQRGEKDLSVERLKHQLSLKTLSGKKEMPKYNKTSANLSQSRDARLANDTKSSLNISNSKNTSQNSREVDSNGFPRDLKLKENSREKKSMFSSKFSELINQMGQNVKAYIHLDSNVPDPQRYDAGDGSAKYQSMKADSLFRKAK